MLVGLGLLVVGCGRGGRVDLEGKAMFGGAPILDGQITLEPIASVSSGGFARIVNGTYDTRAGGRGHPGGPHRVTIAGYDGLQNPNNPDSDAKLSFPPFQMDVDLPPRPSTLDFDVPVKRK